jgi:hypothetical protein
MLYEEGVTYVADAHGTIDPDKLLTHLGLSAQPPPRTPARRVDIFQAA